MAAEVETRPREILPEDCVPVEYNLELEPDLDPNSPIPFQFRGRVEILIDCEV